MACKKHPQASEVEVTSPNRQWRECWVCVKERAISLGVGYIMHIDGKEIVRIPGRGVSS